MFLFLVDKFIQEIAQKDPIHKTLGQGAVDRRRLQFQPNTSFDKLGFS